MLYQITDGTLSAGGTQVLSHFDFEIRGTEKIAVVGANGAGKTTLLRLIAGELTLDRDDRRQGPGVTAARRVTVGMLGQQVFSDGERTVEEELFLNCPGKDSFDRQRFEYELEYDRLFTGFGFSREQKKKKLKEFSGGEQTKLALIRLLLEKPDILLLDEPTNHLDMETVQWLERYLTEYEHAVVMVSHDRFFLDRTAQVVYELEGQRLKRYAGGYTDYRREKKKARELQRKAYERQQQEIRRLEDVIARFKNKPAKSSFARAKKKQIERMLPVEKPMEDGTGIFSGEIAPLIPGSKWVLEAEHLKIGYERPLLELSLRIRRGQKIGLIGANGAGKTTFLKTAAGLIPKLEGKCELGNQVTIGYFDQHTAEMTSEKTVLEHFHDLFPALTEKEVRSVLGAYLFGGREAARPVSRLSGGEKARLCLAELLQSRPNFLILDEPTNHMDIQAREVLESAFQAYTGTILFVSHDRYFIRQVADAVLIFEGQGAMYYPFGYEHYLERQERMEQAGSGTAMAARVKAEDAALIAGIRAVPKAERRRLREISTDEAYLDWKLRLISERLEPAGERYGQLEEQCARLAEEIRESESYWTETRELLPQSCARLLQLQEARNAAWQVWHDCCLEWLDMLEQDEGI
ncbi:MAG: ABC-F family ATP-binding cassette domain-containing protein [Eubacteriales bacterium]|nr:ABC-F family ATP-binding cassette domain-containing protein [Eubacteriales bacterium]